MAAAAILDFKNFKFLTVGRVSSDELRHCAKFRLLETMYRIPHTSTPRILQTKTRCDYSCFRISCALEADLHTYNQWLIITAHIFNFSRTSSNHFAQVHVQK